MVKCKDLSSALIVTKLPCHRWHRLLPLGQPSSLGCCTMSPKASYSKRFAATTLPCSEAWCSFTLLYLCTCSSFCLELSCSHFMPGEFLHFLTVSASLWILLWVSLVTSHHKPIKKNQSLYLFSINVHTLWCQCLQCIKMYMLNLLYQNVKTLEGTDLDVWHRL